MTAAARPRALRASLIAGVGLLLLSGLALAVGRYPLSAAQLWALATDALFGAHNRVSPAAHAVLFEVRAPRVLAAILVGAALSAAGSVYQGSFRNPLVSPDILGVSAGAALGAALALLFGQSTFVVELAAFGGGLAAVALAYAAAAGVRHHDPILSLVLTGVVIGALFGALLALVQYFAAPGTQLPAITFWLLGSLAAVAPRDIALAAPLIVAGLVPLVLLRWRMNLLTLPEDEARALGVPVGRLRLIVVCAATLMSAASVAISGIIGWIGLLVPHAARMLVGPEFSRQLPLAMLMGATFLLGVDTLCRTVPTIELPPGVLTALIGTPFFLWLLLRSRRLWQ